MFVEGGKRNHSNAFVEYLVVWFLLHYVELDRRNGKNGTPRAVCHCSLYAKPHTKKVLLRFDVKHYAHQHYLTLICLRCGEFVHTEIHHNKWFRIPSRQYS
jgi:hypothetical protein